MFVVPTATPVTPPEPLMVATVVLLLAHETPPEVASDTVTTLPMATVVAPSIADGEELIVILTVL